MKIPKKKIRIFLLFFFLGVGIFGVGAVKVSADVVPDEAQIIEVLSNNADFFVQNDIIQSAVRYLGWLLVSVLQFLCNQAEKVFLYSYKLLSFGTGTEIEAFVASLSPIYKTLLVLSITAVGLMTMFLSIKLPDALKNIVLSVGVITCTFFVMSQLNLALYDPSTETGLATWAIGGQGSITNDIVRTNVYDLYYIDGLLASDEPGGGLAGFNQDSLEDYHFAQLTDEDMKKINVGETINFEDDHLSSQAKELLSKRVVWIYGEDYVLEDVSNGLSMFGLHNLGNSFYYRYKVNFFDTIVTLLAFCIVYLAVGYKVVEIIWQMVISRILVVLYSADTTSRKKTMLLINCIKDGYIALFIAAITIRLFSLFQAYINATFEDNGIINVILLIFLAVAVAKGGIEEKLTGHSLGASGGLGLLYGGTQMIRGAAALAKGGASGINWAAGKIGEKVGGKGERESSSDETESSGSVLGGISNNPSGSPGTGKNTSANTSSEEKQEGTDNKQKNGQDMPLNKKETDNSKDGLKVHSTQEAEKTKENSMKQGNAAVDGQHTEGNRSPLDNQNQTKEGLEKEEKRENDAGENVKNGEKPQKEGTETAGQSENSPLNNQSKQTAQGTKTRAANASSNIKKSVLDNVNERNSTSRLNMGNSAAHVVQQMSQASAEPENERSILDRDIVPSGIAEEEAYNVDAILSSMDNETWTSAFSGEEKHAFEKQRGMESLNNIALHQDSSKGIRTEAGVEERKPEDIAGRLDKDSLVRQDTRNHIKKPTQKASIDNTGKDKLQ